MALADCHYVVETCPDPRHPDNWFEDQRNPALWVMRAYARQFLKDNPGMAGRVRIVRCQPLPINLEGD